MDCKEAAINILKYFSGELSREETGVLEEHFSGCAACRKELQEYQKVQDKLLQYPELGFDSSMRVCVLSALEEKETNTFWNSVLKYSFRLVLGTVLLLALGLGYERLYLRLDLSDLETSAELLKTPGTEGVDIVLEHLLLREIAAKEIDYVSAGNFQNALFLLQNKNTGNEKVRLILRDISDRKEEKLWSLRTAKKLKQMLVPEKAEAGGTSAAFPAELLYKAYAEEKKQNYEAAALLYREIIKNNPSEKELGQLAKILLKYTSKGKSAAAGVTAAGDGKNRIKLQLLSLDYEGAVKSLEAENPFGHNADQKYLLAFCYGRSGNPEKAAVLLEKLNTSLGAGNTEQKSAVEINLGILYYGLGNKEKAFRHFSKAKAVGMVENIDLSEYNNLVKYLFAGNIIPNDINGCRIKEGGDGQFIFEALADAWWVGEFRPKEGVWKDYDYFKFELYNPKQEKITMTFVVKPYKDAGYKNRLDYPVVLNPGKNTVEIELAGAMTNGGVVLDWKKSIAQWNLTYVKNNTSRLEGFQISNFRLEKGK